MAAALMLMLMLILVVRLDSTKVVEQTEEKELGHGYNVVGNKRLLTSGNGQKGKTCTCRGTMNKDRVPSLWLQ